MGHDGGRECRASYVGTGRALFALVYKNLLLTLVTLGVYLPWARTERRKYLWQNIEFDGHRLRYHGTGRELFFGYLKVMAAYLVLVVAPLVIAKLDPKMGFIVQIASFFILMPLIPLAVYGSRRYLLSRTSLRGVRFVLEPGAGGFLGKFLLGLLLTTVTFGLYLPVFTNSLYRYLMERTRYGSASFGYDGENMACFFIGLRGFFLTILTLGLYYPWYAAEIARYRMESTTFQGARGRLDITGTDMFWLIVTAVFGTLFSFGLAFPWITTYVMHTYTSKVSFVGHVDYSAVAQRATSGSAATDGFADALDVGLEV